MSFKCAFCGLEVSEGQDFSDGFMCTRCREHRYLHGQINGYQEWLVRHSRFHKDEKLKPIPGECYSEEGKP